MNEQLFRHAEQEMWDWQMALQRYTDTARNEYARNARLIRFGRVDRSLFLDRSLLRSIESPFDLLSAPDDPFGGTEVVEQLVAHLPNAELELVPEVGHWPWLHDPDHAARVIERFLDTRKRSRRSARAWKAARGKHSQRTGQYLHDRRIPLHSPFRKECHA